MPLKTILFLVGLLLAGIGSLRWPLLGVIGYMAIYLVDPRSQWWGRFLPLQRFSMVMAVCLGIAILVHWSNLARRAPRFGSLSILLLAFLALLWISMAIGLPPNPTSWMQIDKMTKLFIFLFMLRRVVTSMSDLDAIFWCMFLCGAYIGWDAFTASANRFAGGRLDSFAGGDFGEANAIGLQLAATLPIAAALFMKYRKLWQRGMVVLAVPLMMNTIVQTRSRTAFLALGAGLLVSLVYSPRRYRFPLVGCAVLGAAGFFALTDPGFWQRMETIKDPAQEGSANQRLVIWRASLPMFRDHPLGVGIGNFGYAVESYVQEGEDRDSHNTYVTCYTELGIQGAVLLLIILVHQWRSLGRASRTARSIGAGDAELYAFALRASLVVYLVGGFTIKRLYAEAFWWYLVLPSVILHVVMILQRQHRAESEEAAPPADEPGEPAVPPLRPFA